jgi:isoleucyl-tRNA synthetase
MKNYKDTLNILKTDFEMKGNLNVKEPKIQAN